MKCSKDAGWGKNEKNKESNAENNENCKNERNINSFEEAVRELEAIVEKLEKGDLTLDESIECFQRGVWLSKFCGRKLDEAEKRISVLIEDEHGEIAEELLAEGHGGLNGFQKRL